MKDESRHIPITMSQIEMILYILEHGKKLVTPFELSVVVDRASAYTQYNGRAVVTPKQAAVIHSAYTKTKMHVLLPSTEVSVE